MPFRWVVEMPLNMTMMPFDALRKITNIPHRMIQSVPLLRLFLVQEEFSDSPIFDLCDFIFFAIRFGETDEKSERSHTVFNILVVKHFFQSNQGP